MDVNPYNPFSCIPGFLDLILDPFSTRRFFSYKNYCTGAAMKLTVNPCLYRLVATFFHGFPIVIGHRNVSLNRSHVSDFSSTPAVRLVVKTKKYPARHVEPPQLLNVRECLSISLGQLVIKSQIIALLV